MTHIYTHLLTDWVSWLISWWFRLLNFRKIYHFLLWMNEWFWYESSRCLNREFTVIHVMKPSPFLIVARYSQTHTSDSIISFKLFFLIFCWFTQSMCIIILIIHPHCLYYYSKKDIALKLLFLLLLAQMMMMKTKLMI